MRDLRGIDAEVEQLGAGAATVSTRAARAGSDPDAGTEAFVVQDETSPASLAGAILWSLRAGAERLVLFAEGGASVAARLAGEIAFDIEVREITGATSRPAPADPLPVVLPGPDGAEEHLATLRSLGLETVLEQGSWRGELLGLEVARLVVWPEETGGDGELHLEAGVGRFDRDAAAAMHAGQDPVAGLERAISIVSAVRHPGAGGQPLSLLARSRWLRAAALADPGRVGASDLHAVETTFPPDSVREESPAAALGASLDGRPLLVVFSTGASFELVPVAADTRALHAPDAELVLAVPARDHHRSLEELAALVEPEAVILDVPSEWS